MSYNMRIKTLEEAYRIVNNQLLQLESNDIKDLDQIKKLNESKKKYFDELRELRKKQYEYDQQINLDEDR